VSHVTAPPGEARSGIDTRVQVTVERVDAEVSRRLQQAFFADIASRYPGWEPASSQPVNPSELAPSVGIWLIAYRDGHAIGCGGLQRLDAQTGEIRRIFLDKTERGRGTGRRLLVELEEHARRHGYKRVRLTTGDRQPEALRMFQSAGYEEIPPFTDGVFTRHWMEKALE
jgi:GNAT superfamily N-acetyltransferase